MSEVGTQALESKKDAHDAGRESTNKTHPGPPLYIFVALVLGVITLIEVGVFYSEAVKRFIVPVLLLLSAAKFALVAGFYMHLRFDNVLFRRIFVGGIVFAVAIYAAVLAMFGPVRG